MRQAENRIPARWDMIDRPKRACYSVVYTANSRLKTTIYIVRGTL